VVKWDMHGDSSALESRLREVAEYEATLRHTPLTSALRSLGRRTRGRIAARLYGLPVLLLDTIGSRSGLPRTSPVIYLRDGDDFVVVGTNWGQFHHPAWSGNLLAHPDAEIEVGPVRLAVTAELADQAAWDRLWTRFCAIYPGYANYLQRCGDRVPRMFLLHPTI